jgi:hypothetical protein
MACIARRIAYAALCGCVCVVTFSRSNRVISQPMQSSVGIAPYPAPWPPSVVSLYSATTPGLFLIPNFGFAPFNIRFGLSQRVESHGDTPDICGEVGVGPFGFVHAVIVACRQGEVRAQWLACPSPQRSLTSPAFAAIFLATVLLVNWGLYCSLRALDTGHRHLTDTQLLCGISLERLPTGCFGCCVGAETLCIAALGSARAGGLWLGLS